MYQLPNMTLEVILKEWHPQEYNPPNTDIWEWTLAMESLCDTYGIPDTQRPQCAVNFIKGELRTELEKLLTDSGPIHWTQFTNFMVALDRKSELFTIEPLVNNNSAGHLRETWKSGCNLPRCPLACIHAWFSQQNSHPSYGITLESLTLPHRPRLLSLIPSILWVLPPGVSLPVTLSSSYPRKSDTEVQFRYRRCNFPNHYMRQCGGRPPLLTPICWHNRGHIVSREDLHSYCRHPSYYHEC